MINTYDHPDADLLMPSVRSALPHVTWLITRARSEDVPVIYANDNFEEWRSHHGEIIVKTLAGENAELVEPVLPDGESLFAEGPALDLLRDPAQLSWARTRRALWPGHQVTQQCVLYSALDAHIRHLLGTAAQAEAPAVPGAAARTVPLKHTAGVSARPAGRHRVRRHDEPPGPQGPRPRPRGEFRDRRGEVLREVEAAPEPSEGEASGPAGTVRPVTR